MGDHCEMMAKEWKITREAQDQLALESHRKLAAAYERGFFKDLVVPFRGLERDGFVDRRAYAVVPPHVDYTLSAQGREVAQRVQALADWIEGNLPTILQARVERTQAARPAAGAARPAA